MITSGFFYFDLFVVLLNLNTFYIGKLDYLMFLLIKVNTYWKITYIANYLNKVHLVTLPSKTKKKQDTITQEVPLF